jgi:hypothetical protein
MNLELLDKLRHGPIALRSAQFGMQRQSTVAT